MYTIRYNDTGEPAGPDGYSVRHARTVRHVARDMAAAHGRAIQVVRIVADEVTAAYIIDPDGTRRPPEGTKFEQRENCIAPEGKMCFCTACRADRRAGRPATAGSVGLGDDTWQRFMDGTL